MNPIQSIGPTSSIRPLLAPPPVDAGAKTTSFKDLLLESIDQVNSMQQDADKAVQQLLTGDDVNTAEVLTAVQKADMSFRMMLQIRNKLVQAYQEVRDIRI